MIESVIVLLCAIVAALVVFVLKLLGDNRALNAQLTPVTFDRDKLKEANEILEKKFERVQKEYDDKFSIKAIRDRYKFDEKRGVMVTPEQHYFCTSCLLEGVESQLTTLANGWRCERKACEKFYKNPDYRDPTAAREEYIATRDRGGI